MGVIGCTLWMSSCKQAPEAQTSANYAIMKVTTADKELSTSYSATIRGRQDIDIYPQVSGTIERLCVSEGEKVRKGQLLFIIDQVTTSEQENLGLMDIIIIHLFRYHTNPKEISQNLP